MIYLYEEDGTTFKVVKNEQQGMQPRPRALLPSFGGSPPLNPGKRALGTRLKSDAMF